MVVGIVSAVVWSLLTIVSRLDRIIKLLERAFELEGGRGRYVLAADASEAERAVGPPKNGTL